MTDVSPPDGSKSNARGYFIVAYAFLLLLALFWSVADFFVYLFIGAAAICLFLGIQSYIPSQPKSQRPYRAADFGRRQRTEIPPQPATSQSKSIKIPKVVGVVFGVMIFIVVASFVAVIFSDDDDSDFNYQMGNSYYEAGKYDSAAMFFRKSLKSNQTFVDAFIGYGNAKLALIQNDSAIMFYDHALELDAENLQARYQKGRALYFNKNYEQSIPLLENLVLSDSGNNDAIQLIGDSFYNQQKYDSALKWYDRAYATGFRNTYLCYLMGYIYETKNNNNKAVDLYKEAIQFDQTISDLYSRLGTLVQGPEGDGYRTKAAELEAESKR